MWGDPGVTELQMLRDASFALSAFGITPANGGQGPVVLQHVGLLRRLALKAHIPVNIITGVLSPAGTLDVNGPWNLINQFRADVNGIAPLYVTSGWGAYLISFFSNPFGVVDNQTLAQSTSVALAEGDLAAGTAAANNIPSGVYGFPASQAGTPSPSGFYNAVATTPTAVASPSFSLLFVTDLPYIMDMILPGQTLSTPTELGLWLLQNQTVDMVLTFAFSALTSATPGSTPYQGALPVANLQYGSATIDIEREFYRIPSDPSNMPILAWAHQWVETYVPFSGNALDLFISRAGILLRCIAYIFDATTNDGILPNKITQMTFVYGANETPMIIDPVLMRRRQVRDYGRQMPKGAYVFDWPRWDNSPFTFTQSFKLMYNTEAIVNQRVHFDFGAALAVNSYCRFLVERLIPIVANRNASPVATSGAPVGAQQSPVQTGR
jgi:hypothetical protein